MSGCVLGADGVVGGDHAGLGITVEIGAVDVVEHRLAAAELEDEAAVQALGLVHGDGGEAAQDRGDLGHREQAGGQGGRI